jgi:hypothetical protein
MTSSAAPYEENRRRRRIADEEWAARQPYGAFSVTAEILSWAGEVVAGSPTVGLPFTPATVAEWGLALGVDDGQPSLYLGHLLDAIVAGAQRDGILVTPEPGVVAVAYAHRDRQEGEVAEGWGFKPAASRYLVIHARSALDRDEVAGGPTNVGAAAIAGVVQAAAASLSDCRQGPEDSMLHQLPLIIGSTSRTPRP